MGFLSREEILSKHDMMVQDVEVPEWGGTVRVRSLTGEERDNFEKSLILQVGNQMKPNLRNIRAKLVALSVVDKETGKPLFSEGDLLALSGKNAAALNRVYEAAEKLSGLSKDDMEELAEGFSNGQSGSSTSD